MLGSRLLFFRRGFTTAVLKKARKTPFWREQFTMYNSWSSKNPQSVLKNGVGIGSNRQVVGFTWEKTRPSVLVSTRAKLSIVSSGKINDPGVLTFKIWWGKRLDLMSLILLLKWSAKSSQRASVGVLKDLLKLRITLKVVVKKAYWIWLPSWPQGSLASAPQLNHFSKTWATSMSNLALLDEFARKCA